ncbi:hypothetical protein MGG_17404 [Pyricularia oryzae 70-15]|uniref:Uncharacterized protein n=2 Tax=Pyricularia oryzae TaxID=318829 RepID=G4NB50_PYRO7|nr:uncharacterized protein MGG_17404 [Pyricularia oryzae 70-15]EHA48812.1 hypothetical protein MGG_17404 [Pyricularia oryzae 70-15]ELQ38714.1 hypothetical protein OOU_Y34scaffold00528g6 [Pyricularia oryzae Y34]
MATPPEMLRATTEDQINEQEHQVKDDSAAKENDRHLFQDHTAFPDFWAKKFISG